jgi:ABC-type transport system involved in cytochrome c biogenesis permease component
LGGIGDTIRAIFVKDLVTELRAKQMLPTIVCLGALIAWIFRIAAGAASVDISVTAGAVLLIAMLFAGILVCEKSFAVEQENDCIGSLLLAPVDAGDIYLAKLLVNIVILCIFEVVTVPIVLVLFKVSANGRWLELFVVLLLGNIGISSVGTMLGCVVHQTRAAGSLLSVLVMAVLMPMMIPAIVALLLLFGPAGPQAVITGTFGVTGDFKAAVGYMTAFDAIFVTVCWLLFGLVAKD